MDYTQPKEPEDTCTDEEELNCMSRTDNLTESEVQQLPVKMPRFGFGDYLSQQSCFRNLLTVQNSNAKYMVAHIRQILETSTKEPLSEDEWIDVLGRHLQEDPLNEYFDHKLSRFHPSARKAGAITDSLPNSPIFPILYSLQRQP